MKIKILFSAIILSIIGMSFVMHPLKMSVADVTYKDNLLNLKFKIFSDDLESTLQRFSKINHEIITKGIDKKTEKSIQQYIETNFAMEANGVPVKWSYKKSTLTGDREVVYVEYEGKIDNMKDVKTVKIKNTILFDGLPEQKNIVNLHLQGTIKVLKFDNGSDEYTKKVTY